MEINCNEEIIADDNEEIIADDNDSYIEDFEIAICKADNKPETKRQYCWKREHVNILIDMFEKHPVLYNPNHKDYGKMNIRRLILYKLLKEMRKIDREITMNVLKEKLRNLRNQFLNEVRLLKIADKNNELYIPKFWCFERMCKLYKGIIEITPFYDNNVFDEDTASSKLDLEEDSFDNDNSTSMEFEEFFKIPNENEETYEIETINITNHNNEDLGNECVNTIDVDDFQPSKRFCSRKDLNELNPQKSEISHEKSKEDINHNWLGDLVMSQLGEIAPKYHNDFAWDVQCLIRKYVLKSKTNADEITICQSSESTTKPKDHRKDNTSHELVLSKTSNISFNISFV